MLGQVLGVLLRRDLIQAWSTAFLGLVLVLQRAFEM